MGTVVDGHNRNNKTGVGRNGKSRYAGLGGDKPSEPITWAKVDRSIIAEAIGFVTAAGDAIVFGRTADGGALVITVLSGADRHKFYAATVEQAIFLLHEIIDASGN